MDEASHTGFETSKIWDQSSLFAAVFLAQVALREGMWEKLAVDLYAQAAYNSCVAEAKTGRVHLRVAASDDELLRHAAAAVNQSLSEFLVESGRERAERVLADRTRFVLSPAQWRAFTTALDRPVREIPELVELFRRPRPE
jgi:uncharacterized protein (DUF1778 family)